MSKKILSILLIGAFAVSISACWDKVEIDQRGFVDVIMVDMAPSEGSEEGEAPADILSSQTKEKRLIKVTYTFPNATAIAGESGGGGGGGDKPVFTNISSVAATMDEANRYANSKLSRRLFFGFTQAIIFGEDFLKNPDAVKEVLDYFRRDPDFGRYMRVLVSEGEASKIAEINPKGERLLSRYIRGILDNEASNGRISDITFNEFIVSMVSCKDGVLPKISLKGDELKIASVGFIKDYKLIGYISEYDSMYYNALKGKRKSGSEIIDLDGVIVNYVIRNSSRHIELINDDPDNLEIGINVKTEGIIPSGETDLELYSTDIIKKIEQNLDKNDAESSSEVIKKIQKDYNIDILMIGDYIKKYHPAVWDKVKDKWEDIYPNIKIIPVFENKIRRIGTVK